MIFSLPAGTQRQSVSCYSGLIRSSVHSLSLPPHQAAALALSFAVQRCVDPKGRTSEVRHGVEGSWG